MAVMKLSITDTQYKNALHYAECHFAEWHILFIVMLSVIMLNVDMLSAVAPLEDMDFTNILQV
jgi:hypothetical protein